MKRSIGFAATLLAALTVSGAAMAQYYDRDGQCRQYAAQAVAPMQQQAAGNTVGSALVGAGLGAALGAAAGGGRGAAIGAASGAAIGGAGGAAANSNDVQAAYNSYYYQCMGTPPAPAPGYGAPPPYGYR